MKINSGQKVQSKYGSGVEPQWAQVIQMGPEPEPKWTLNSGQKVQPKYGSGVGSGVEPPK